MKIFHRALGSWGRVSFVCATVWCLCCVTLQGSASAQDETLEDLLTQVGAEYAEPYSEAFIHAFGANQNSNLYSTAHIPWEGLTFGVGLKVMGSYLNEEDQTFRKVVRIDDLGVIDPALDGQSGTAVLYGPTIFGDTETDGKIDVYANGILVGSFEGISGFWDTRWVPLATPEVSVGGIVGLKATLRYFPPIQMGDFGKTDYLGFGLQWSPNGLLTDFPVDLMVGFFNQGLNVENTQGLGEDNLIDSSASSYFVAASKSWPALTLYGGFAIESSEMTVSYFYPGDEDFPDLAQNVKFKVDGRQEKRFTVGVTLDILLNLNLEAGFGDLSTYSAGLMFGF
jgi:hypothetical protein